MNKIETLGQWGAQACLHSVLEDAKHDDSVIVVTMRSNEHPKCWTANVNTAVAVFMLECVKQQIIDDAKE